MVNFGSIAGWIIRNKLSSLLSLILLLFLIKYFIGGSNLSPFGPFDFSNTEKGIYTPSAGVSKSFSGLAPSYPDPGFREFAPTPGVKDRMVVESSQMSLLVKDVISALSSIKEEVATLGGYMVESSLSRPEEAASGQITLRVPSQKLDEALNFLRSLSVKVVSENLFGEDVTDQFVDNEARLAILVDNKARFQEIMKKAVEIQDILQVQQEIFNIQSQIDSIKGQQNYLTKTSQMAKVVVYLSTDELALPYSPTQLWRPEVVFKLAVRSLLSSLQGLGSKVIWLAVYSVIWLPILVIAFVAYTVYKGTNKKIAKS